MHFFVSLLSPYRKRNFIYTLFEKIAFWSKHIDIKLKQLNVALIRSILYHVTKYLSSFKTNFKIFVCNNRTSMPETIIIDLNTIPTLMQK